MPSYMKDLNKAHLVHVNNDDVYVKITLDVRDDSVTIHSVKTADGLEKKSFFCPSVVRNALSRIRQVSQELKLRLMAGLDGRRSGLIILLPPLIGCFLVHFFELFDALARRRNIIGDSIIKTQLKEFWDQISHQIFDCRLQTFFDMMQMAELQKKKSEIISLSASANKLSSIQKHADEYASLIMEELEPNNKGYILIENLEMLLLQALNQSVRGNENQELSQMLSQKLKPTLDDNPIRRGYQDFKYFLLDNWQRVWVLLL
ncbi:hypothetical protein M9H77_36336 [Catharanthus roseus]|uniref:Uncharacterized protein n=1 Tax=Catharanthus roseus TaxID=4058 RepID=A0ACB9ZRH0_CATRO|nr:hypothetical protein M9H77_36336 [Catharanthus roseus]